MREWKTPYYHLITTEDELNKLVNELSKAYENKIPISIDIETTGSTKGAALVYNHGWILGISIALNIHEGYYIPIRHTSCKEIREGQLPLEKIIELLNPILSSPNLFLGHNLKFDYKFLFYSGIKLYPAFWDTYIAHKLILGGIQKSSKLKDTIMDYVNIPNNVIQTFEEASEGNAAEVDPVEFSVYAINDVIFTYYLYEELKPIIDANYYKLFYEIEAPLTPVLAQEEMRGIRVDYEYFKALEKPLLKARDKIFNYYKAKYGLEITSTKQLSEYFKTTYPQYSFSINQKSGQVATGVEVLQQLERESSRTEPIHRDAKHLLFFRGIEKALNTYIKKFPRICDHIYSREKEKPLYILHTNFNQIVNSGRQSSSPNVQNFTKDSELISIRGGFIARPGYTLIEKDWSGQELRILAVVAQEKLMLQEFLNNPRDADLHTLTASIIFNKDPKDITSSERYIGKTINFSLIYGATEYSLSKTLNKPKEEVSIYIKLFYDKYSGILTWKQESEKRINQLGYSETLFGRRRYLPKTANWRGKTVTIHKDMEEFWIYEKQIRNLQNHIIQGTGADILKMSQSQITKEFAKRGLDAHLITSTHDSNIAESSSDEETLKQADKIMTDVMEINLGGILLPVGTEIKNSFAKSRV